MELIKEAMRTIIEVNDSTESFKVVFYHKDANETPQALKDYDFQKGAFVRIAGNIRCFKEETVIIGNRVTNITKHDEVTNHFL